MINIARPMIGAEEKQAVLEVLDSGIIAQGPRVQAFEKAFAEMCGVEHAIATTSGTTALHTALLANEIGPGDEVITSPFTFIASANSILYVGARPVFIDIDPKSFNLNPELIEAALTPHTKAIMPVHLFGLSCDMDPILKNCTKIRAYDYRGCLPEVTALLTMSVKLAHSALGPSRSIQPRISHRQRAA